MSEYDVVSKITSPDGNIIYITSATGVHQCDLAPLGLRRIVNVDTRPHHVNPDPGRISSLWRPFEDNDDAQTAEYMLRQAQTIRDYIAYPAIIHCQMGVSRSVSIAIYLLMLNQKITADGALAQIRAVRPCASPNDSFMKALRTINPVAEEQLVLERRDRYEAFLVSQFTQ